MNKIQVDGPITTPFERKFNPYDFNGGYVNHWCLIIKVLNYSDETRTTICIAGPDFALAAGCTRMSTGYQILSRNQSKLTEL